MLIQPPPQVRLTLGALFLGKFKTQFTINPRVISRNATP